MDWKEKLNSLYDVVPKSAEEESIIEPQSVRKQHLRIELDKRKGKFATLITEFEGSDNELKDLAKHLKVKCGVGGSARGGEILIQGDFRAKAANILEEMGYKVKHQQAHKK